MRRLVFVAALLAGLGLAWWWTDAPPAPLAPPPVVATVEPAPAATVPEPPPPPKVEPPSLPPMAAGFCIPEGQPDTFTRKYTLQGLLSSTASAAILVAIGTHDPDEKLSALRQARKALPNEPAIALDLAFLERDEGNLDVAIDGIELYQRKDPQPALARLKARLEVARDIQKNDQRQQSAGITLLWPPGAMTAVQADGLLRQIDTNLDEAARLTDTLRRKRLTAIVYADRSELLAVSCVATWTSALYDGVLRVVADPKRPEGYIPAEVKHESMHAQIGPLAPRAPKWFHEGLAQSFANQTAREKRWRLMLRNHVWVPFSSLDGTFQAFDADLDAELAYSQAYAMVEMMRDAGGDASISTALRAFSEGQDGATALARACGKSEVTGDDLLAFMQRRLGTAR